MNESEIDTVMIDLPNFPNICRICLETDSLQLFIEDYLIDVFKTITSIEVENEGFCQYICKACLQKLEEITDFCDMARYNDTEYKRNWMRKKKLKEGSPFNEQKYTELVNNPSQKKDEAVLLDTDNEINDVVISDVHIEPRIKAELFDIHRVTTKEEVHSNNHSKPAELSNIYSKRVNEVALINAHNQMTNALSNIQADVRIELSTDSDTTSEVVLLNTHSEVTNEVILINKVGEKTQAASFFSSLYESRCPSNSLDQNSGVVTITDTESEPESNLSFVSHLQVGNLREGPDKLRNSDRPYKRRQRRVYNRRETLELEKEFLIDPYGLRRAEIAESLGLSVVQVRVWFQNRRMKQRKEKDKIKKLNHEEWKKKMILDQMQGIEHTQPNFNAC